MSRLTAALLALTMIGAVHAATLTGETSKPTYSVFVRGEPVLLRFAAAGVKPQQAGLSLAVTVSTVDEQVLLRQELPVTADEQGRWEGTLAGRSDLLGYYHVTAKLSTGETLPAVGSRPAGYLTYMVVTDPANRLRPGESARFGLQGGFATSFDMRPYLGATWVLGGYNWGQNEPDRAGQFAEKRKTPDPKAAEAREKDRELGIQPLFCIIGGIPKWAQQMKDGQPVKNVIGDLKAFSEYCTAIGKAAQEDYPWLQHHVFQVTWEPVYPWGFEGTEQDLVNIYQAAYPALHAADPKAIVIGPTGAGISASDVAWNERLLQAGIGKYIDALAIHPYIGQPPEDHNLAGNIRALQEIIRTRVGHDLDLYGTEQGFPTGAEAAMEKPQAMWLTRTYIITAGEGFKMNTAFYACDYPGEPGYGFFHNLVIEKQAWGPGSVGPKPAAAAFAAMTMLLEGHRSNGAIEGLGPTTVGYAFERDNQVTLALWDYGKEPHAVTLAAGAPEVELFDWMGNGQTVNTANGTLKLTLGAEPQYVRGLSPQLWGSKATRPLVLKATNLTGFPGATVKLPLALTAPAQAKPQSRITARLDDGLATAEAAVTVPPGKAMAASLDLHLPAELEAGAYPVQITATDGASTWGVASAILRVRDPVSLEGVTPLGQGRLAVALRNLQPTASTGTLEVRLPGVPAARAWQSYKLPAQGAGTITLDLAKAALEAGRTYTAALTVREQGGLPHRWTRPVTFTDFGPAPTGLTIDGDLSEWAPISPIRLQGRELVVRQPQLYRGRADLSADVRCTWDSKALYLAVEVTDDAFVQEYAGFNTWKGDCLQVGIDTEPSAGKELTGNLLADTGSRTNVEIDLALTPSGPQVYRTLSPDATRLPVRLLTAAEAQLSVTRTEHGLRYEAALPWKSLGRAAGPPAAGRLGFALAVNDMDDPKQLDPKALGLFGGVAGDKNPALFGVVALTATSVPARAPGAHSLTFDGALGQSEPAESAALPWTGCAGVTADATGDLWAVAGSRVYHFAQDKLRDSFELPTGMKLARGDAQHLVCLSHEGAFYEFDLRTRQARLLCKATFADGSAAAEFALAANGDLYGLSRAGVVQRWDRDGKALGTVLQLPPQTKWDYRAIGVDPVTGDLWIGTYYPDMHLLRFRAGDKEPVETKEGFAVLFAPLDGGLWWLGGGGEAQAVRPAAHRRPVMGGYIGYPTGAAPAADGGTWVSCAQGLVHFDALGRPTDQRLGGLAAPGLVAVSSSGTVVSLIENSQRTVRLLADDDPNAAFASNSNEPWRVAGGWAGKAVGLGWMGGGYMVLDTASKALWRFDPEHVAWAEKPWVRLTEEGALPDPRALAVGDTQAYVLDGARVLRFAIADFKAGTPATAPTAMTLPEGLEPLALATVDDEHFYALTAAQKVVAFKGRQVLWTAPVAGTALAANDDVVAVADAAAGTVSLLDAATGAKVAELTAAQTPGGMRPESVAVYGRWLVVSDSRNSRLLRLKME